MSQSNTIFQTIIDAHFPTLNAPARHTRLADELRAELAALPALEDESEGECACCGSNDTYLVEDADPSTGYYDCALMCRTCGGRAD